MDNMMLTYFWLKFISMPLFTVCAFIYTHTHTHKHIHTNI